jgi:hypothetical protein
MPIHGDADLEVLLLHAIVQENRRPRGGVARVMRLLRERSRQRYEGVH